MSFDKKKYHKQYHKEWYEKNKELRKKQIWTYAQNHKEDSVKKVQKYVLKNKEKVDAYNKRFNQTAQGKYRLLLYRAKRWGSPYISLEEFEELQALPCKYCGETDNPRGIDRINNLKGYTRENSASCCKLCNFMKKTMLVEEFILHAKKISRFNED